MPDTVMTANTCPLPRLGMGPTISLAGFSDKARTPLRRCQPPSSSIHRRSGTLRRFRASPTLCSSCVEPPAGKSASRSQQTCHMEDTIA